ncbi:hypothetical protein AAFF_G00079160 [Aldrovandia affinis]|uniref:Uncharacterized protein n=1 Tax=Aldrovandia affinis TaxID=143900 RepID=A0AAD7RXI7_9TELE|nr:hypothetical protein AAFF_G00079160 [Aldrovandia affinis]
MTHLSAVDSPQESRVALKGMWTPKAEAISWGPSIQTESLRATSGPTSATRRGSSAADNGGEGGRQPPVREGSPGPRLACEGRGRAWAGRRPARFRYGQQRWGQHAGRPHGVFPVACFAGGAWPCCVSREGVGHGSDVSLG